MDTYPLTGTESHYQPQRQHQWPPHLNGSQPPFNSPSSAVSEHYSPWQSQSQGAPNGDQMNLSRQSSSLSLNLSSLSVASPTNLSPINPPSAGTNSALSPVTPISPASHPFSQHHHHHGSLSHNHMSSAFQFPPPTTDQQQQSQQQSSGANAQSSSFETDVGGVPGTGGSSGAYDHRGLRISTNSRSSSSASSNSLPPSRKRSFTSNPSSTPLLEEPFDDPSDATMDFGGLVEDSDMRSYAGTSSTPGAGGGGTSPVDGSGSGGDDDGMGGGGSAGLGSGSVNSLGGMGMLGKPMATNNFVTKLYQMINDSKSASFISWTELGTSFVVSNVGEFSRSILGSHFKHNNFSSFVRQLNMYGFHKINRTPRAQRTSTDAQTWEFSHHKFLRGRPDLLDEIKRKALEPDPSLKHRVELPGEVAAQLNSMRDDNRRMWEQLTLERRKVEKLTTVVTRLWNVVGQCFPDNVPPFPADLLEGMESPNIYVTSPTSSTSRYPTPLAMGLSTQSLQSLHSMNSPGSSPTTGDFPSINQHHHQQHRPSHSLSRQHSFQHIGFSRGDSSPGSPGEMNVELFDDAEAEAGRISGVKRQRMSTEDGHPASSLNGNANMNSGSPDPLSAVSLSSPVGGGGGGPSPLSAGGGLSPPKKSNRTRSDSAPQGHHGLAGPGAWTGTGTMGRPRSGSGMAPQHPHQHQHPHLRATIPIPGIGMSRAGNNNNSNNGPPLLSIMTVPSNAAPLNR